MDQQINTIFEDSDIIVIEKPSGLVVNKADTVKHAETVQAWAEGKIEVRGDTDSEFARRGGVVHRLDKETSGLLILAKNEDSFRNLQDQFKERVVKKEYVALVHGEIEESGVVNSPIKRVGSFGKFGVDEEGRQSETSYKRDKVFNLSAEKLMDLSEKNEIKLNKNQLKYLLNHASKYSLVNLFPKTGRTHQIRVHMKSIGAPLVSDSLYTPRKLLKFDLLWCPRLFLHAKKIQFIHPASGEKMEFESIIPQDLSDGIIFLQ